MKKASTSINEHVRLSLDITRDEYALCSYVHYRCADPRQKIPGFCCDNKEEIAQFIGITRPGLFKMLDRMQKKDLVFVDPATRAIKSTPKWIDTENDSKQSLQNDVNKVYKERKQSLHGCVNKVTVNIEVEEDLSKSKLDLEKDSAPENSTPLNAEKKDTPPIPAAPPIIRYSDIPRFVTPVELEDKLNAFFSQNIDEWKTTVETGQMEYSKRGLIFDECSAVKGYCEWATENATMRNKDYQAHNARLRRWVRDQPGFARGSFSTKPKQQINPGSSADKFKEKQAF